MARARRVVLVGNSLVALTLAWALRQRPELEILQVGSATPEALEELSDARLDAVILSDLPATPPDLICLLLREYPGLPVIGVDLDGDRMVMFSSRQASLQTKDDLLEAIGQERPSPGSTASISEGKKAVGVSERRTYRLRS